MQMPARDTVFKTGYRYGFNGKEMDNEPYGQGNEYDYGFRVYNPRIGRFFSVDPLTTEYSELTPYQYASNRPIDGVDMDGLEWSPFADPLAQQWQYYNLDKFAREHNIDPVSFNKRVVNQIGKGSGITLVTGLDIFVTRGWLTRTLMGAQIAGAFEHNRATTLEGRAEQDRRSKEALTNAFIAWGTGKIIGQSITFFRGPQKQEVNYLFRGTSQDFEGSPQLQKLEMTPTSSDPVVATVFAINAKNYGKGVLLIALPKELQGVTYSGNVLESMEREVGVGVKPSEFANKASITITADQARSILKNMGIDLPAKISLEDISKTIKNTPRLSNEQITEFYKEATQLKSK